MRGDLKEIYFIKKYEPVGGQSRVAARLRPDSVRLVEILLQEVGQRIDELRKLRAESGSDRRAVYVVVADLATRVTGARDPLIELTVPPLLRAPMATPELPTHRLRFTKLLRVDGFWHGMDDNGFADTSIPPSSCIMRRPFDQMRLIQWFGIRPLKAHTSLDLCRKERMLEIFFPPRLPT
jgi:hypothetical protein